MRLVERIRISVLFTCIQSSSVVFVSYFFVFVLFCCCSAPPSPILAPGSIYSSPSASFQSLLANISAAQHSVGMHQSLGKAVVTPTSSMSTMPHSSEFLSNLTSTSPPISSPNSVTASTSSSTGRASPVVDDRRSSSIAALRLKAREHELRLEMLRQNGQNDILG